LVVFGNIVADARWFGIAIDQWVAGMLAETISLQRPRYFQTFEQLWKVLSIVSVAAFGQ
jgi:hypothetical protein